MAATRTVAVLKYFLTVMMTLLMALLPFSLRSSESVDQKLAEYIKFDPAGENLVGWISIEDHSSEINQATFLYVKTALEHYKKVKPIFIVLELNTPGGEVFAAQKISDMLKEMDIQEKIPVVAFINNWAISAGAMLAYSCRYITVVKDASMGAAEPITIGESGKVESVSEKVNSALRADFGNRAAFFGRNPVIAEAMVDKDIILVWRQGQVIKLEKEDQIQPTDTVVSAKGKLLTLTSEEMMKYGVADLLLPPVRLEPITPKELDSEKWPASKTLLFTYPFFKEIPHATVDKYRMDWKMQFFALLASPAVSSLLYLGLMLGLYMEISNPGLGLPGTLAITCLFLITLSSFALEIANWLELILLLAGLAIILVEVFILPTFGLLGFIGIVFFLMGLFGMMLPGWDAISFEIDTQTLNAAGEVFFNRLAWLGGTTVVALLIIAVLSRYAAPNFAAFRRFVLSGNEQVGYIAGDSPAELPKAGEQGEVLATLRPAGKIVIRDKIYDAISYGSFIEKGQKIVVDRLEGSVIVVSKVDDNFKIG